MGTFAYEIQQTMPKVQAVERLLHSHHQQPENDQQTFAATVQQKIQEEKHKVGHTAESDKGKILDEKKDKVSLSTRKDDKKKKKQNPEEQSEETDSEKIGRLVDISI